MAATRIGGKPRQDRRIKICPADFDRQVPARDVPGFGKALEEGAADREVKAGKVWVLSQTEKANHRH
jgi:hypothetical protein